MVSQNPSTQDCVLGSKVRRADTGGQTHADERGFGKWICVTGEQVNLVSRNAIPPRADAATKATGPSSSTHDSSVIAMDGGKENIAPPEVEVPKVRGGELLCCLRNRPSFPRDDFRARQPRRRRARSPARERGVGGQAGRLAACERTASRSGRR